MARKSSVSKGFVSAEGVSSAEVKSKGSKEFGFLDFLDRAEKVRGIVILSPEEFKSFLMSVDPAIVATVNVNRAFLRQSFQVLGKPVQVRDSVDKSKE